MRHRKRRSGQRWALVGLVCVVLGLLVLPFRWPDADRSGPPRVAATRAELPAGEPTRRASPQYLRRAYRAPPALVRRGAGGVLRVPSLGIVAPVDAVGLDGGAMAVPNDPARVGWLTSTARATDVLGASVLASHVSDVRDRPGALARLGMLRPGAEIRWTSAGKVQRFRVERLRLFPRSTGLPASLFTTNGPHVLHLVTCADKVATATGFHYRSNLVVTAVR